MYLIKKKKVAIFFNRLFLPLKVDWGGVKYKLTDQYNQARTLNTILYIYIMAQS